MTQALVIEHLCRRPGGTQIPMPPTPDHPKGVTYHFKPSSTDERHLAVVADAAHIRSFMAIPEGFAFVSAAPVADAPRGAPQGTEGSAGASLPTPAASPEAPSSAVEAVGAAPASEPQPAPIAVTDETGDAYDSMSRDELAQAFEARFGRKCPASATKAVIIERLRDPA